MLWLVHVVLIRQTHLWLDLGEAAIQISTVYNATREGEGVLFWFCCFPFFINGHMWKENPCFIDVVKQVLCCVGIVVLHSENL